MHASRGRSLNAYLALTVPVLLAAGLMTGPSASATGNSTDAVAPAASTTSASAAPAAEPTAKGKCVKKGGVLGLAAVGGQRVTSAKVEVFARGANDKSGRFTKKLNVNGSSWTNDAGGFQFSVPCLPKTFLVKVSGGRVKGKLLTQKMWGIGRASERGTVVTPVTTVPVRYLHRNGGKVSTAIKKTTKFLKVTNLGNEASDFGLSTRVTSRKFSPAKFVVAAKRHGGVKAFSTKLAKKMAKKGAHQTFRPKGYVAPSLPGYPKAGSDGTPRSRAKAMRASLKGATRGSSPVSILYSVAGKAAYTAACAELPQSPVTNMACANPDADMLQEISNQLVGISNQLDELQASVNEIISMLDSMTTTLDDIDSTVNEIETQELNVEQQNLYNEAAAANSAYSTAYNAAGIATIQAQVNDANADLQFLGTITPVSSFTPVAPGSSNAAMCGTMYSALNTSTGQNPLDNCADFLSQTQSFASGDNAYYSKLYQGLVGGSGVPTDNLLIWTMQEALTYGMNNPVSSSALVDMQNQVGQLGQLMGTAYAMLASAQMFEYNATTGDYTTCPTLATTTSYTASTPIKISDACDTLNSALFALSVINQQAPQVSVPMTDTVADPKTNAIWWAYPFDVTGTTSPNSKQFPFFSGTEQTYFNGTGVVNNGQPVFDLSAYTQFGNPGCCTGMDYANVVNTYPADYSVYPLVTGATDYTFWIANQSQLLGMFNNYFWDDTSSIAGSMQDSGFQGIGTNTYGMKWTKIGVDTGSVVIAQNTQWNSTTAMGSTNGCTGFPPTVTGTLICTAGSVINGFNPQGYSTLEGTMATSNWDLTGTVTPNSSNATTCPTVGYWGLAVNADGTPAGYPNANNLVPAAACESNTFGLMVDTAAQSPDGKTAGKLPPFWSTKMLDGPAASGVTAVTVPQPTVYPTTS